MDETPTGAKLPGDLSRFQVAWQAAVATRAASSDEGVGHSFEEEWPEFARRLERFLAAKGVETWLRGDVIQETATRVYRKWSKLNHSRPLWNLVVTIALGILVDERRKASRIELVPDVPQSDVDDVEIRALYRVHIAKTRAALNKLSANQRRVLLAEIGEVATLDGSRSRIKVLRLRARLALKGELGPWAPAGVALRMRSLRAGIERRIAEWGRGAHGVAASVASVAVAATLLVPAAGGGAGGGAGSANGGPLGSLTQRPEILGLEELRQASLYRMVVDIPRPKPPKPDSKAQDQANASAEKPLQFVEDEMQRQEEWAEGQRQWAEGQRQWAEDENQRVMEREKERVQGDKEQVERDKEQVERDKEQVERDKEQAEEDLSP